MNDCSECGRKFSLRSWSQWGALGKYEWGYIESHRPRGWLELVRWRYARWRYSRLMNAPFTDSGVCVFCYDAAVDALEEQREFLLRKQQVVTKQ